MIDYWTRIRKWLTFHCRIGIFFAITVYDHRSKVIGHIIVVAHVTPPSSTMRYKCTGIVLNHSALTRPTSNHCAIINILRRY